MITEYISVNEDTGEFLKTIKGHGFSISLEFDANSIIRNISVCELGKNHWVPLSTASYDNVGNLLSKYIFLCDESEKITEFTELNHNNDVIYKTIYHNNNGLEQYSCLDKDGNLIFTKNTANGIYKDANGNEVSKDVVNNMLRKIGSKIEE